MTLPARIRHGDARSMNSQRYALLADDVVRTFRSRGGHRVEAVRGVSLRVRPGEIVALLGPNGAGKTTFLDTVLGFGEPTRGRVEVYGMRPAEAIANGLVGALLQTGGLLRDLTVGETVRMVASLHPVHAPVDAVIDRAGLGPIVHRRVAKCSGGEQQRLRFALALLPDPQLLVLDEPTAGMDVVRRREFWATMREEAARGRTIVFATHYLNEVEEFAERVVVMTAGRIVADGTIDETRALAGGRRVTAEWPEATDAALADLDRFAGVGATGASGSPGTSRARVERDGTRIVVTTSDSDAVARYLLERTGARGLTIAAPSLDEVFTALTEHADAPSLPSRARPIRDAGVEPERAEIPEGARA